MTDTIFSHHEIIEREDIRATLLHAHQGWVLRISEDALALYRSRKAVDDPLGNGCIGHHLIPDSLKPVWRMPDGYITSHQAGFVGLNGGAVLFVRPDGVGLYHSAQDALRNHGMCWFIPFESLTTL